MHQKPPQHSVWAVSVPGGGRGLNCGLCSVVNAGNEKGSHLGPKLCLHGKINFFVLGALHKRKKDEGGRGGGGGEAINDQKQKKLEAIVVYRQLLNTETHDPKIIIIIIIIIILISEKYLLNFNVSISLTKVIHLKINTSRYNLIDFTVFLTAILRARNNNLIKN